MVKAVNDLNEFKEIISKNKMVVVDFFAEWCGPCKRISPHVEKYSEEFKHITFIKVDVDAATDVAEAYNIQAMPTFMLFKDGAKVAEMTGADQAKLKELITIHLKA